MTKFTVLLLRPDYLADEFGHDTHLSFVLADSVKKAIASAQKGAAIADRNRSQWRDYYPLMTLSG